MRRTDQTNNILEELHDYCLDVNNRQIYLHGSIKEDSDTDVDFKSATRFIKNMAFLEVVDEAIVVHQLSHGGDTFVGFSIYDCIKMSNCHVSVVCHGVTMSMGTVILQAADERLAMPNCTFMFHEGTFHIDETFKASKEWMKVSQKQHDKILDIYANRCVNSEAFKGKTVNQVKNYISKVFDSKQDWILTAEEALHLGFIDRILKEKELKDFVKRS